MSGLSAEQLPFVAIPAGILIVACFAGFKLSKVGLKAESMFAWAIFALCALYLIPTLILFNLSDESLAVLFRGMSHSTQQQKPKRVVVARDFTLTQGQRSANAVEGLKLRDTALTLTASCDSDISLHIDSNQPLPIGLAVTLDAANLGPPTRVTEETYDSKRADVYRRHFKMNTFCNLLTTGVITLRHPTLPQGAVVVDLVVK
jgi:hypothetical protein